MQLRDTFHLLDGIGREVRQEKAAYKKALRNGEDFVPEGDRDEALKTKLSEADCLQFAKQLSEMAQSYTEAANYDKNPETGRSCRGITPEDLLQEGINKLVRQATEQQKKTWMAGLLKVLEFNTTYCEKNSKVDSAKARLYGGENVTKLFQKFADAYDKAIESTPPEMLCGPRSRTLDECQPLVYDQIKNLLAHHAKNFSPSCKAVNLADELLILMQQPCPPPEKKSQHYAYRKNIASKLADLNAELRKIADSCNKAVFLPVNAQDLTAWAMQAALQRHGIQCTTSDVREDAIRAYGALMPADSDLGAFIKSGKPHGNELLKTGVSRDSDTVVKRQQAAVSDEIDGIVAGSGVAAEGILWEIIGSLSRARLARTTVFEEDRQHWSFVPFEIPKDWKGTFSEWVDATPSPAGWNLSYRDTTWFALVDMYMTKAAGVAAKGDARPKGEPASVGDNISAKISDSAPKPQSAVVEAADSEAKKFNFAMSFAVNDAQKHREAATPAGKLFEKCATKDYLAWGQFGNRPIAPMIDGIPKARKLPGFSDWSRFKRSLVHTLTPRAAACAMKCAMAVTDFSVQLRDALHLLDGIGRDAPKIQAAAAGTDEKKVSIAMAEADCIQFAKQLGEMAEACLAAANYDKDADAVNLRSRITPEDLLRESMRQMVKNATRAQKNTWAMAIQKMKTGLFHPDLRNSPDVNRMLGGITSQEMFANFVDALCAETGIVLQKLPPMDPYYNAQALVSRQLQQQQQAKPKPPGPVEIAKPASNNILGMPIVEDHFAVKSANLRNVKNKAEPREAPPRKTMPTADNTAVEARATFRAMSAKYRNSAPARKSQREIREHVSHLLGGDEAANPLSTTGKAVFKTVELLQFLQMVQARPKSSELDDYVAYTEADIKKLAWLVWQIQDELVAVAAYCNPKIGDGPVRHIHVPDLMNWVTRTAIRSLPNGKNVNVKDIHDMLAQVYLNAKPHYNENATAADFRSYLREVMEFLEPENGLWQMLESCDESHTERLRNIERDPGWGAISRTDKFIEDAGFMRTLLIDMYANV